MGETTGKKDPEFDRRLRRFLNREFANVLRSQQLMVDMTGLEERLQIADATDFERRHRIPRGRIDQLEDDSWNDLSREHLLKLLALESEVRQQEPDFQLFSVVPDPIWATFETPAIGFIGKNPIGERVAADHHMLNAFRSAGISLLEPGNVDVVTAMRETNCIFVGSPKWNTWTEQAIEALWPDGTPDVRFSWPAWPDDRQEGRASKKGEQLIEFLNHKDDVEVALDRSPGSPVGALIVCRSPLASTKPVTTIIAAGPSKYGTFQVVEDILSSAVYVWSSQLVEGKPSVFVLKRPRGKRWYNVDGERQLVMKQAERRKALRRRP